MRLDVGLHELAEVVLCKRADDAFLKRNSDGDGYTFLEHVWIGYA